MIDLYDQRDAMLSIEPFPTTNLWNFTNATPKDDATRTSPSSSRIVVSSWMHFCGKCLCANLLVNYRRKKMMMAEFSPHCFLHFDSEMWLDPIYAMICFVSQGRTSFYSLLNAFVIFGCYSFFSSVTQDSRMFHFNTIFSRFVCFGHTKGFLDSYAQTWTKHAATNLVLMMCSWCFPSLWTRDIVRDREISQW